MLPVFLKTTWRRVTDRQTLTGQISLTMGANLLTAMLGLITGMLSARLLGPEGRGELAAIQVWFIFLSSLAMLGMVEAVIYFGSRAPAQAGRSLASAQALIMGAGVLTGAASWWLMPHVLQAQAPAVVAAAQVLMLLYVPAYAAIATVHQSLRAAGAWLAWNVLRPLPNLCWLLALLAVLRFAIPFDAILASKLYLATLVLPILPCLLIVRQRIAPPYRIEPARFRALLGYGLPAMLASVPQLLNLRIGQLVMTALLAPESLGLYVVAVAWSTTTLPFLNAIGPVLFPRISATTDPAHQRETLLRVLRMNIIVVLVIVALQLFATPLLLPLLFGADYRAAVPAALLLVVAGGFSGLNLTLSNGLRGLGHPQTSLIAEVLGLVVTALGLLVLLSPLGILGAAAATLLAYASACGYLAVQLSRAVPRAAI